MNRLRRVLGRGAALLALTAMLATPAAFADEGTSFAPPEARISPPIGASAQCPGDDGLLAQFFAWLQARISPPIG